jgi:hypothetical protein
VRKSTARFSTVIARTMGCSSEGLVEFISTRLSRLRLFYATLHNILGCIPWDEWRFSQSGLHIDPKCPLPFLVRSAQEHAEPLVQIKGNGNSVRLW